MQTKSTTQPPPSIDARILAGIFAHRIRPGSRLGEAELAELFSVSRTLVREAMMRLQARRIVEVRPRRGWFVAEPSPHEAREVFQARRAVETGAMRLLPIVPSATGMSVIREHLDREHEALTSGDRPALICLMGDFHIRVVELLDNPVLADILRDLTARTILISTLYQSEEHAEQSHRGHCLIFEAIEAGDRERAEALAISHLDEVEAGLRFDMSVDPLSDLRRSLDLPQITATAPSSLRPTSRTSAENQPSPNQNQRSSHA